jgi:uncharacterized protein
MEPNSEVRRLIDSARNAHVGKWFEQAQGAIKMAIWNRLMRSKRAAAGVALASLMTLTAVGGAARVSAQDATPTTGGSQTATITVNGVGNVSMTPDTASVTLGVTVVDKRLKDAQAKANAQMQAVIDEIKADGVDEKDIQTSNFSVNVNQSYDNNGNPGEVTGYTVNNQVNVTVRNLSKLGSLLDDVVQKGANSIWGINFYVNDQTDAAKQARTLAVQDATQHAKEIAEAAGGSLGKIISIDETSSPSPVNVAYDQVSQGAGKAAAPIQTGSAIVTATMTITFELVQ